MFPTFIVNVDVTFKMNTMKRFFTLVALLQMCHFHTFAQTPTYWNPMYFTDSQAVTNSITPLPLTTPGFSPGDTSLDCMEQYAWISDTIYFTNYNTFSGLHINYLKIDSIYLPAGLFWSTNKASDQLAAGETGAIGVQGFMAGTPCGQYKLRFIVDINAGPNSSINLINRDLEDLFHIRYRLKVNLNLNHFYPCPALNTTDTTDAYIAYVCTLGVIDESTRISYLSFIPNPFSHSATLSFNAENQGTYTVKMTNLIGAVVSTKEVNVVAGKNDIAIERNGLSTGIYLLSITNGQSALTKKVIIE